MTHVLPSAILALLLVSHVGLAANPGEDYFESKVRPLLVNQCFECHGGVNTKGGLSLDTRSGWEIGGDSGPALVPGKPEASRLIQAVRYEDPDLAMPPKKKGGKLGDADIAVLEEWIRIGAPDPRVPEAKLGGMSKEDAKSWWAFQPLPKPDPQPTPAKIDAFLNAKLNARVLAPVGIADKRTLLRRITYDLTGLPPAPEEVEAFLADASPDAFGKVVERLLASPKYGVRWGRHWLDVVRYADTAGENTDRPLPHAWRYRNWVFDRFNRDEPFDDFLRLQLAGDLIRGRESEARRGEGIVATGYLALARRFGHDIDKRAHLMYEDVIDNLGKNFLGLTIGCARCHDHKYDPVTSQDYYALYGIFESTRFAFPGCEKKGQPRDLVPLMPQAQINALMKPWRARVAKVEAERKRRATESATLKKVFKQAGTARVLSKAKVEEGASVRFAEGRGDASLSGITVRKGEILQLTVFSNESHGADSTRIEWSIVESDGEGRSWSVAELVPALTTGNPHPGGHGAAWCFYESTDGPAYLTARHDSIRGNAAIKAWKLGDTPSVFVNAADQQVMVWTTLAAESFFMHPGPKRPVSVAWVSPVDGAVDLAGTVSDAHPSGGDGVAFRLDHLAAPELGSALVQLGRRTSGAELNAGPKPVIPVAYAVADAKPGNARLQQRGDPENPGEKVPRRWLAVFGGEAVESTTESGRRDLADWVAGHPLTARVMVNRIWQWHFGWGLVRTPNNFGSRGERPSHPELLDWLAAQFVASGYSVKAMHHLILHTEAYRRAGDLPAALVEADPDNRLLGRFSRRRLGAEEIRDSLLFVSGQLDPSPARAHPFPKEDTWKFTQHNPFNAVYPTKTRSAYLMVQRQRRHPFLALFDGADPNASAARRETTTVPTQALYFLNDPFFHEQAAAFAGRLRDLPDDAARLRRAYRILFQRGPAPGEVETARRFLADYPAEGIERWRAYARVLLASNEFLHVD